MHTSIYTDSDVTDVNKLFAIVQITISLWYVRIVNCHWKGKRSLRFQVDREVAWLSLYTALNEAFSRLLHTVGRYLTCE